MDEYPDSIASLVVTSPPYNVGKEYENDLSETEYLEFLELVFRECYRVLRDGGRICVNVAGIGRSPYIPLHHMIGNILSKIGFLMRCEIIWDKGASVGVSTAWGSWCSPSNPSLRDVHEYILVFSKNQFKSENIGDSTISKDDFLEYTKSIWQFGTANTSLHPAPFPVELPKRLIELYTGKNEIVLDPFMGSGTTAVAAKMLNRHWLGYEIRKDYISIANKRVESVQPKLNLFLV